MNCKSVSHQYYATFAVNLIGFTYGIACGWPSPTFPVLASDESQLASGSLTPDELSWIAATLCIGGFIGTPIFGWLTNNYGRKKPLVLLAFPGIICWVLTLLAQNISYLIAARFFIGFCGGGLFVVLPMFISEISEDRIRGTLSSKLILFANSGIVFAYVVGNFVSYTMAAGIYILFPVLFLVGVFFIHETPYYLMRMGREKDAELSLVFYRNVHIGSILDSDLDELKLEFENLRMSITTDKHHDGNQPISKLELNDFTSPVTRRALFIGFGLVTLNQLSGLFAMINYTATIFEQAGSSLSPNVSAIIVAVIQLVGSYIASYLCDKVGRKILLIVSSLGTSFGLAVMGAHMLWFNTTPDFNWVPVTSFSFVILICSCGIVPLTFVIIAEIMPEKIRSAGASLAMSLMWILAFVTIKYFYGLTVVLGMHGCMFLFAGMCLIGAIFIIFCLPETKGKSFEEIQELLR